MKKVLLMVLCLAIIVSVAVADNLKLTEFSLNSGKGAFTSGLDVTVRFGSDKYSIEVTGNSDRAYGVFFWKLPLGISVGVCAGEFKNQPQTGPYVVFAPVKFAYAFYWSGWGFGEPDKPSWDVKPFFSSAGIGTQLGNLKLSLIWFDFMGAKTWLPGISYGVKILESFWFSTGMDYKTSTKEPLFWLRVSYFPK